MARKQGAARVDALRIVVRLGRGFATAEDLQKLIGGSRATVMRAIAEARAMGAMIEARQRARRWEFDLLNAESVVRRATGWLECEESGDLVDTEAYAPR